MLKSGFITTLCLCFIGSVQAQKKAFKQEFGINMAGLFVKNQATIAPSFLYRYKINNYQIRLQLALDSRITKDDRTGLFKQSQANFISSRDTDFVYEPAKNNTIGFLAGLQKNKSIQNSGFSYFFGIDFIYMLKDYKRKGKGSSIVTSGSSVVQTQTVELKTETSNRTKTLGLGVPLGITYHWDKRFYASLESKFVMVYQMSRTVNKTESIQQQTPSSTFILEIANDTRSNGFDIGIKPLTGICFGVVF